MKRLRFPSLILILAGMLALGCRPASPSLPAGPAATGLPPTKAPTEVPLPTSTAAMPPSAYATQDAARGTAIAARAAASPFPTAGPAVVQTGQPSVATARRDGLVFEIRLPQNTYLAGEGGRAEVILHNGGPETVFVTGGGGHAANLALLDEWGHEPPPWPWAALSMPGFPFLQELTPGQVLTSSVPFQVPPWEQARGHEYVLWTETRFSRPAPDQPRGPDNLWLRLEAGPVSLQVAPPAPAAALLAELEADRYGWQLRVTDSIGQVPSGPFWGLLEAVSANGAHARPLEDSPDRAWSGSLDPYLTENEAQAAVRAWVAAPGYVVAAATRTVPGKGDTAPQFYTGEPPAIHTFPSLAAAQAAIEFPLYRPGPLPGGVTLETVQVETWASDGGIRADISQRYRLPGGQGLELAQAVTTDPWTGFGYGSARHDLEAHTMAVGQATGYAIQRFGLWLLEWKCDGVGLVLRAPVTALALEDLAAIAAGVRSPEGTCPPVPTAPAEASPPPPTLAPP